MAGFWDWLNASPGGGGGVLSPDSAPPVQRAPNRLGLFGATLQDIGANLGGDRAGANHLAGYDEDVRTSGKQQAMQLLAKGFAASDPAARAQAYQTALAWGIDPAPYRKQAASAAMPDLLKNLQPRINEVVSTPAITAPGQLEQRQAAGAYNQPITSQPSIEDALSASGSPELTAEMAPDIIKQRILSAQKDSEPYTLVPGQKRFRGSELLASVPERNNPNQPFNADGTPNKAYQDYKAAETKAAQAPQWANVELAKQRIAATQAGAIEPETLSFMAQQVLAGDKSPFANIGRGVQGAGNLAALRKEVMTQAQHRGLGGADVAALNAEFAGLQAGERTLGVKTANVEMASNEARNLMPLVLDASAKVSRTQYPSINKIIEAGLQGTGDENVVRLGVSLNGLVNTYARAISPTGNPTVDDKHHAREILDKAWSAGQIAAAVGQMDKEIAAAQRSPGQVRGAFRSAISGSDHGAATVPDAPSRMPSPQSLPRLPAPAAGRVIEYDAQGKRK